MTRPQPNAGLKPFQTSPRGNNNATDPLPSTNQPSPEPFEATPNLGRSRSRRGLSLSTVSPLATTAATNLPPEKTPPPRTRPSSLISPRRSMSSESLPTDIDHMDIDAQLRLLALKEQEQVDLRGKERQIHHQISVNDHQLHKLREAVQRSLYREMGSATPTPSRQSSTKRATHAGSGYKQRPRHNSTSKEEKRRSGGLDERWSMLFDESPLKSKPEELVNHVWTLVNDMKQGLLSSLSEEDTVVNQSDDDDLGITNEDDTKIDLAMYSGMRRKRGDYVYT
ncbi:hypothetical protein DICA4_A07096 [Diutina catenulata]